MSSRSIVYLLHFYNLTAILCDNTNRLFGVDFLRYSFFWVIITVGFLFFAHTYSQTALAQFESNYVNVKKQTDARGEPKQSFYGLYKTGAA